MRTIAALSLCTLALAGCADDGPAERAGAALDDTAEDVADAAADFRAEADAFADDVSDNVERPR